MGELTMRIEAYLTDLYTMSADGLTTTEFEQMKSSKTSITLMRLQFNLSILISAIHCL